MTVEQTLRNCLLLYPSIFPNKWEVYHHWFLTNGSGYEWKNGELVDISNSEEITLEEAVEKHFKFRVSDEKLLDWSLKSSIKELKKDIISTLKWEERAKIFEPYKDYKRQGGKSPIYPLCEYAQIMNIPENIKDDWKEATQEMYEWLSINYNKLSESDKTYVDKIKL